MIFGFLLFLSVLVCGFDSLNIVFRRFCIWKGVVKNILFKRGDLWEFSYLGRG